MPTPELAILLHHLSTPPSLSAFVIYSFPSLPLPLSLSLTRRRRAIQNKEMVLILPTVTVHKTSLERCCTDGRVTLRRLRWPRGCVPRGSHSILMRPRDAHARMGLRLRQPPRAARVSSSLTGLTESFFVLTEVIASLLASLVSLSILLFFLLFSLFSFLFCSSFLLFVLGVSSSSCLDSSSLLLPVTACGEKLCMRYPGPWHRHGPAPARKCSGSAPVTADQRMRHRQSRSRLTFTIVLECSVFSSFSFFLRVFSSSPFLSYTSSSFAVIIAILHPQRFVSFIF